MKKITEIILDKEAPLNLKSLWAEPQEDSTVALKVFNNGKWASTSTKVDLSAYALKSEIPDISGLATTEALNTKADKTELENVVRYTDISDADDTPRKTIMLDNNDTLSAYNTAGTANNIAMISKWDVVNLGSTGLPINLNGSKERPTYNDSEELALVSDISEVVDFDIIYTSDKGNFRTWWDSIKNKTAGMRWGLNSAPTFPVYVSNYPESRYRGITVNTVGVQVTGDSFPEILPFFTTSGIDSSTGETLVSWNWSLMMPGMPWQEEPGETTYYVPTVSIITKYLEDKYQSKITPGTGLAFKGNTLNVTLDTTVFKVVSALPDSPVQGDENKIHLVPAESTGTNNIYTEYVWVNSAWEILGQYYSQVDLSNYYTKEEVIDRFGAFPTSPSNLEELNSILNEQEGSPVALYSDASSTTGLPLYILGIDKGSNDQSGYIYYIEPDIRDYEEDRENPLLRFSIYRVGSTDSNNFRTARIEDIDLNFDTLTIRPSSSQFSTDSVLEEYFDKRYGRKVTYTYGTSTYNDVYNSEDDNDLLFVEKDNVLYKVDNLEHTSNLYTFYVSRVNSDGLLVKSVFLLHSSNAWSVLYESTGSDGNYIIDLNGLESSSSETISTSIGGYNNLAIALVRFKYSFVGIDMNGEKIVPLEVSTISLGIEIIAFYSDKIVKYTVKNTDGTFSCTKEESSIVFKSDLPSYTTVPELTTDYTIPANATTREFVYEIPVGGTPHNITGAEGIKWASGVAPTTQINHTYIVSVINNLAVWGEF